MKVIDQINKKFGQSAAFLLGEKDTLIDVPVIPTGSLALDLALGVGGLPRGRITEVYGPEGSGKTTLCQHVIANAQQQGGAAAFIDVEHALDPHWLEVCGVDIDQLVVSQPDTGEQALDIAELYIRSKEIDVIVIDSVAALVPRAEIEGEMGDSHMGLQARLMSQAMRKLSGAIRDSNCVVIFTNQLRQKIGVVWGNPETTTGGMALRFYASIRLDMKLKEAVKQGEEQIGNTARVIVKKNKVAPPFKTAEFDILYGKGISYESELIELAIEQKIIEKGGAWFTIQDEKVQGKPNLIALLENNISLTQDIEDKIRTNLRLPLRRINDN